MFLIIENLTDVREKISKMNKSEINWVIRFAINREHIVSFPGICVHCRRLNIDFNDEPIYQ